MRPSSVGALIAICANVDGSAIMPKNLLLQLASTITQHTEGRPKMGVSAVASEPRLQSLRHSLPTFGLLLVW